jgi:hypothetical protein
LQSAIRRIGEAVPFLVFFLLTNVSSAAARTQDLRKDPMVVDRESRVVVMEYEAVIGKAGK